VETRRGAAAAHGAGGLTVAVRSQVFIADLLESLQKLHVGSAETAQAVMRMLSLEDWHEIVRGPEGLAEAPPAPPAAPATAADATAAPVASAQGPAAPAPVAPGSAPRLGPATLRRLPSADAGTPPAWAQPAAALPRAVRPASPPPAPLLAPRRERALLAGLAASLADDGEPDVSRVVDALARGLPLTTLPLTPTWSTRRGLQVLVDDGPGMAPFRGDVTRVLDGLADVVPADRIERLAFEGCPLRGCRVPRRKGLRRWHAPARGAAVLLLSDLGIGAADPPSARANVAEWLAFAAALRGAGVTVRTLVPYPAPRWPRALVNTLHPVPWDRATTVAQVRRTLGAARYQYGR
jgi:hypothetical protein